MARRSIHERLSRALPDHYRNLRKYRELRRTILRDYAGTLYPENETIHADKAIVNLTQQAAEAMIMTLSANRPRVIITAKEPRYRAFAGKMERALNRFSELISLEESLQDIVRDAFSGPGIAKVCLGDSLAVGMEVDYRMDPGRPYVQRVCLDHFTFDTAAATVQQASFFADRYRVSYDQLMGDARFRKFRNRLEGLVNHRDEEEYRFDHTLERAVDYVWLADCYVPHEARVYTYVVNSSFNLQIEEPIAVQRWTGDESGPYYLLNLGPVPDEIMPSSPGQNLKLLSELNNAIYRKLENQARRQKVVTVGHNSNEKDAEILRQLRDGEHAAISNPDAVRQLRFDGPDNNLFGFFLNAQQQFSRAAGNLDHKLGLRASADTIGQESMLGAAVNRMEGYQQQRYVAFVRKVMRGVARLLWLDGFTIIPGTNQVPGTQFQVDDTWLGSVESNSRQGDFANYLVDIDPFSMAYKSPQERLMAIRSELQQWLPVLPMLAQMGIQPDIDEYFRQVSRLQDLPEITQIFKTNQPPLEMAQGGSGGGATPKREYIHRSAGSAPNPDQEALSMFSAPPDAAGE